MKYIKFGFISIGLILAFCSSAWSSQLSVGTIKVEVNGEVVPMADYYSEYKAVMAGNPSDKAACEKTQPVKAGVTVFRYAGDAGAGFCKGNYKSISFSPVPAKKAPPFTVEFSDKTIADTGNQYSCHATIKLKGGFGGIKPSAEASSEDGCHVVFGK